MKASLRTRTTQAFRGRNWVKGGSEALLGAPWEIVKLHIESNFQPGMDWNNYGEWHIDHVHPLVMASSQDELIQLCHYTNLQPLWATQNLSKGARRVTF